MVVNSYVRKTGEPLQLEARMLVWSHDTVHAVEVCNAQDVRGFPDPFPHCVDFTLDFFLHDSGSQQSISLQFSKTTFVNPNFPVEEL